MMRVFGQIVLQQLFVFQVMFAATNMPGSYPVAFNKSSCCQELEVQDEGSSSGTYILVPTCNGPHIHPECRETCHYVKDSNPDPEELFCFVLRKTLTPSLLPSPNAAKSPPTCQKNVTNPYNSTETEEVIVLSLNETEQTVFLNIFQQFPSPPGEESVTFYSRNCTDEIQKPIDSIVSLDSTCVVILLDENSSPSCEEQWKNCTRMPQNGNMTTQPAKPLRGFSTLAFSALASWSLKWCPGRIGQNPNRLCKWPQCCFHPITQRPKGGLWQCLIKYTKYDCSSYVPVGPGSSLVAPGADPVGPVGPGNGSAGPGPVGPGPKCTTISGPATGLDCVFPFIYLGLKFSGCTTINDGLDDPKPWCATATDGENILTDDLGASTTWGYCSTSCPIQNLDALIDQINSKRSEKHL